jgi:tRNA nucleotidyltransferase (CCA-adding enzyme)
MEITVYEVGGKIRDEFMGLKNKDIDYAVEADSYYAMREYIISRGGEIFLEKPEFVTIRARIGRDAVDYVLCRKDGTYSDNRRPDFVTAGTIFDDLARRDFTMNAIARNIVTGEIIDPFSGQRDISHGIIRCVGEASERMMDDSLRLLRAIRFSITKNMIIEAEISRMFGSKFWTDRVANISQDRIRDEVSKMFVPQYINRAFRAFARYPMMAEACFEKGMWMKPTNEKA